MGAELHFSGLCLSECILLSFSMFGWSLSSSRKTTSLLEQHTSHFLPALPVLPASCLTYSAAAAFKGQHQRPDLSLGTFCPPRCSEKLGNLFLQASGSPVCAGHFSVREQLLKLSRHFVYLSYTHQ